MHPVKSSVLKVTKAKYVRPTKRHLVRWTTELNNQLLLAIQAACNHHGVKIPWDQVASETLDPRTNLPISEGAIIQHLAKMRSQLEAAGMPIPDPLKRGGKPRNTNGATPKATLRPTKKAKSAARSASPVSAGPDTTLRKTRSQAHALVVEVDNSHVGTASHTILATKTAKETANEADSDTEIEDHEDGETSSEYGEPTKAAKRPSESANTEDVQEAPEHDTKRQRVQSEHSDNEQDAEGEPDDQFDLHSRLDGAQRSSYPIQYPPQGIQFPPRGYIGAGASYLPAPVPINGTASLRTAYKKSHIVKIPYGKYFGYPNDYDFRACLEWGRKIGICDVPHDIRTNAAVVPGDNHGRENTMPKRPRHGSSIIVSKRGRNGGNLIVPKSCRNRGSTQPKIQGHPANTAARELEFSVVRSLDGNTNSEQTPAQEYLSSGGRLPHLSNHLSTTDFVLYPSENEGASTDEDDSGEDESGEDDSDDDDHGDDDHDEVDRGTLPSAYHGNDAPAYYSPIDNPAGVPDFSIVPSLSGNAYSDSCPAQTYLTSNGRQPHLINHMPNDFVLYPDGPDPAGVNGPGYEPLFTDYHDNDTLVHQPLSTGYQVDNTPAHNPIPTGYGINPWDTVSPGQLQDVGIAGPTDGIQYNCPTTPFDQMMPIQVPWNENTTIPSCPHIPSCEAICPVIQRFGNFAPCAPNRIPPGILHKPRGFYKEHFEHFNQASAAMDANPFREFVSTSSASGSPYGTVEPINAQADGAACDSTYLTATWDTNRDLDDPYPAAEVLDEYYR